MVMDTKKESKLFKTNPIAKQVRTPKFKPQVIKNKILALISNLKLLKLQFE